MNEFEFEIVDGKVVMVQKDIASEPSQEDTSSTSRGMFSRANVPPVINTEYGIRESHLGRDPNSRKTLFLLQLERKGYTESKVMSLCDQLKTFKGVDRILLTEYILVKRASIEELAEKYQYTTNYLYNKLRKIREKILMMISMHGGKNV